MTNESSNEHMDKPGDDVTEELPSGAKPDSKVEYSDEVCAEVQAHMAERIGAGEDLMEDPHIKTCSRCGGLIKDLEQLAAAVREAMKDEMEPSDTLWDKIESVLKTEGDSEKPNEQPPAMLPSDLALETGSV